MNFLNSISNFSRNFIDSVNSATLKIFNQLGIDLNGEAGEDNFGYSVAMNAAGDRIVVGAPLNDAGGVSTNDRGHIRVFSWDGTSWTQLGIDVNGEVAGDNFGHSVAMNAAGDRIVVGAPYNDVGGASTNDRGKVKVYSWNGSSWIQLGSDINGQVAGDNFGYSVAMNASGNRIVIGAPYNDASGTDSGNVRVYYWNGSAWTQLGTDINGGALDLYFGFSVSVNVAGDKIAIGSYNKVYIHYWNGSSWTQLGTNISNVGAGHFGYSVSMNASGDILAVGAPYNDDNGTNSGSVNIYSWNGTSWTQLGTSINGQVAGDNFGKSVSMNTFGDVVAIGIPYRDVNGTNSGSVNIYSWNGTSWIKTIEDINGTTAGDTSGSSVSMNATGDIVTIGEPFNSSSLGQVRIYKNTDEKTWLKLGSDIEAPNTYLINTVSLNATGNIVAVGFRSNFTGLVRVYKYNQISWQQIGLNLTSGVSGDSFGESIAMNAAGDRIIIGAPLNDDGGASTNDRGKVKIYSWNGSSWTQLGLDLVGEAAGDYFGYSVAMNAAGDRIVVGAPQNDAGGVSTDNRGHVRAYSWNGTAWIQLGSDINGLAAGDSFGEFVKMNALGDRIIVGSQYSDAGGLDGGQVRVFSYNGSSWVQLGSSINGAAYSAIGRAVNINASGNKILIGRSATKLYEYNGTSWVQDSFTDGIVGESNLDFSGNIIIKLNNDVSINIYQKIGSSWQLISTNSTSGNFGQPDQISTNFAGNIIAIKNYVPSLFEDVISIYALI